MKLKDRKQLVILIPELDLFSYYSLGNLVTKNRDNFSFVTWPDGKSCLIGNLYIIAVSDRSGRGDRILSRRDSSGGTVGGIARDISQLIRYCFYKNIYLTDINDDIFSSFVSAIRTEVRLDNPTFKVRNENRTNEIGRRALDFLSYVGKFYKIKDFVAPEGIIRGEERIVEIRYNDKRGRNKVNYQVTWTHTSISSGEPLRTRDPIDPSVVLKLREANKAIGDRFLQQRRTCLIDLLENTGARRGELTTLTVSDIMAASKMQDPMLRLDTLKGEEGAERTVPVSKGLLNSLKKHIRIHRNPKVKRCLGLNNDHDYFFVSDTTGMPLDPGTLGSEIYKLRKAAGVTEAACAHMFRHAFCTNLFVLLIQRHQFNEPEQFKALLNTEAFKAEVAQWTGHKNIDTLKTYIDLAYQRLVDYSETISSANMIMTLEYYSKQEVALLEGLTNGELSVDQYREELTILHTLRKEDMKIAERRGSTT
ncbi:MAG: tyrosine-type recombinase/integrase [Marinobacter sp.]|uniref:tyrosine-type recombinase/integrase n=1 Tax=Marinobacter sp. TaxID=50741 RepID=UPI00329785B4